MLASAALAAVAVSAVSIAATPSSGKVDKANPSVSWEGTLANAFISFNVFNNDPEAPCAPTVCDAFDLTVADGPANLELVVNLSRTASTGTGTAGIRITRPDGSQEFVSGPSDPDKAFKHVIKNAPNGEYGIDTVDSFIGAGGYTAKATLLVAGAATTGGGGPGGTPSNPPPANGSEGDQPGPAQPAQPSPKLTVKAAKASAKKLSKSRKLSVALTTTGPLTKLTAVLRKGKATVAKGSLAKLDSKGRLTLKFAKKKLKKGTYALTVQGLDAQNRTVTAQAKVKVAK